MSYWTIDEINKMREFAQAKVFGVDLAKPGSDQMVVETRDVYGKWRNLEITRSAMSSIERENAWLRERIASCEAENAALLARLNETSSYRQMTAEECALRYQKLAPLVDALTPLALPDVRVSSEPIVISAQSETDRIWDALRLAANS